MAKDAYHEMFLHIVWHTKGSANLIAPDYESGLHDIIRRRAVESGGVFVHEVNGTRNHVHLVVRVPPTLQPAEWIGRVKGGSSHDFNEAGPGRVDWQSGYGIVTFGMKDLPWVMNYVRNQKEHHLKGTVFERLERVDEADG